MWRKPMRAVMDRLADKYITQPLLNSPTFVRGVQSVHKHFGDLKQGNLDMDKIKQEWQQMKDSPDVQAEFQNIKDRSQQEFANMRQRTEELKHRSEELKKKAEHLRPTFFEWLAGVKPEAPADGKEERNFIDANFKEKK